MSVRVGWSSIGNGDAGSPPDRAPKGLPRTQTIGSYVETLPRTQTILYVCLDDFLGRATALPEARAPAAPSEHSESPWGRSPSPCALFLSPRTRYIYREEPLFPAAWSSSKSLPRAVSIISSLMRLISCFFSFSDRPLPPF